MNEEKRKELTNLFIEQVYNNAEEIDPNEQYHWESLILGWAIAKDLTLEDALDFALRFEYPL